MVHLYRGAERPVFGHEAILTRPHLAAHIGAVAAIWTIIEESWGHILADALDAEAKTGVAMYLALTGATSQGAILQEAVKMHLPESIQQQVTDARKNEKGHSKDRNRIVHGRWGIVPSDDRYLVLGERDWLPKAIAHSRDVQNNPHRYTILTPPTHPDMEMRLYSKKDFEQIEGRLMDHYHNLGKIIQQIDVWRQERRLLALMLLNPTGGERGLLHSPGTAPEES